MQDTVDQAPGAVPRTLARHHRGRPGRAVRPVLGAARWAASRTAGQAHSSRSRICCTWLTDSATSRARRNVQVPQTRPGLMGRLRQVAAQLRSQPGDQHRVLVIGLVESQVLRSARPGAHQRLHAHKRHPALGGQLPDHPQAVTGRLGRDGHPGEPGRRSPGSGPVQRHAELPCPSPERPPRQHPSTHDPSPRPSACCQPDRYPRSRCPPAPPHAAGQAGVSRGGAPRGRICRLPDLAFFRPAGAAVRAALGWLRTTQKQCRMAWHHRKQRLGPVGWARCLGPEGRPRRADPRAR
jgi:hypothetical protein